MAIGRIADRLGIDRAEPRALNLSCVVQSCPALSRLIVGETRHGLKDVAPFHSNT